MEKLSFGCEILIHSLFKVEQFLIQKMKHKIQTEQRRKLSVLLYVKLQ